MKDVKDTRYLWSRNSEARERELAAERFYKTVSILPVFDAPLVPGGFMTKYGKRLNLQSLASDDVKHLRIK